MRIHCAIVDDNKQDLATVQNAFETIISGSDHIVEYHLCTDPQTFPFNKPFNIYILDIDMPGLNGFELAERIYSFNPQAVIVFCTMHNNLVFNAFRMNAFYFVRKSNLLEDLIYALRKYTNEMSGRSDSYVVRKTGSSERIHYSDIICFSVIHNDIYIRLVDGSERSERKSLKAVREEAPDTFLPVGKTYLVNCSHISKIEPFEVTLADGKKIQIPKSQYNTVLKEYLQNISR